MNPLFHELVKRKEFLEELMTTIRQMVEKLPEGKLRISNDKGIMHYYRVSEQKDTCGKYIPKKNYELACQLAQKDYVQKLYREAESEWKSINFYLKKHGEKDLEDIYTNLNPYRKGIVEPLVLSDEMYIQQWENELFETNKYYPGEKVYPTKKDEMVRSKSEVLLADMYYELGIPYRYEAKLELKNNKVRYSDFTLLKVKTRVLENRRDCYELNLAYNYQEPTKRK